MKILYVSALCSKKKVNEEFQRTKSNPGFAVQKFNRLLVKGLQTNGVDVLAFSNPPLSSLSSFSSLKETEDGISYKYIPRLNIPLVKHLYISIYAFFYVFFWGFGKRKDRVVICDVLSISACLGALFASKLCRLSKVAVVTDMYGLIVGKKSFLMKMAERINELYIKSFDKYVLLTEQMNDVVNPYGKPYIVMEALCDVTISDMVSIDAKKEYPRTIVYAGGIHENYGLKMLAEAFLKANVDDVKLVYYGSGPYVEEYKKLCSVHGNLEYRGVATNDVIMIEEKKASLLVNPRFSKETLSKYSFPSKNMEFMASGTPLLTTKLPGMPKEYHAYVYLFKEETIDGFAESIREIMNLSENELNDFGRKAQQFVLQGKNNVAQGKRILQLLLSR